MICCRSYELTRKDKLYKNIQRMQHSKVISAFESLKIDDEIFYFPSKYIRDLLLYLHNTLSIISVLLLNFISFNQFSICPQAWCLSSCCVFEIAKNVPVIVFCEFSFHCAFFTDDWLFPCSTIQVINTTQLSLILVYLFIFIGFSATQLVLVFLDLD